MSAEALDIFFRSADVDQPCFSYDELARWPKGSFEVLRDLGVLREADPAKRVECDACSDRHLSEVIPINYPDGQTRFFIPCPENGRIEIPRDRLRQWAVDFNPLIRLLAEELKANAAPAEVMPGRLWNLGRMPFGGRSKQIWVARGLCWPDAHLLMNQFPQGKSVVLFLLGQRPGNDFLKLDSEAIFELRDLFVLTGGQFHFDLAENPPDTSLNEAPAPYNKMRRKDSRAGNIQALKRELQEHMRAARDHAYTTYKVRGTMELLPRPEGRHLAKAIGVVPSTVSRILNSAADLELRLLWEAALDLQKVCRYKD